MKKLLVSGTLGLLILAIGVYITMQFFLGSIVKAGVNKFGPGITQTRVELKAANLSPLSGEGTLNGLAVGNPKGWSEGNAFQLGRVQFDVEPASLFGDHIVINEITIEQPEFLYETKLIASNIGDLLKNIEQAIGKPEGEPKSKSGKQVKMVIKKLTLRDGRVTLGVGAAAITMPMPPVHMTDIGTAEGGLTPGQVALAVMRNVMPNVVAASAEALARVGGTGGAAAAEAAKQAGQVLKGIFGGEKKKQ
jgi:uncharacterized protein involved in outer membrane biogenesis